MKDIIGLQPQTGADIPQARAVMHTAGQSSLSPLPPLWAAGHWDYQKVIIGEASMEGSVFPGARPDVSSSLRVAPDIKRRLDTSSGDRPRLGNLRDIEVQLPRPDATDELRDTCISLARRAEDAFREACASNELDEAEANYGSAVDKLEELWDFAYLRDRPFRDLLALLEAALRCTELSQISETQRDVIKQAFSDLPKWMLEQSVVDAHVEAFADHDVDITGPIRTSSGQRFRVTIEEINE